MGVVPSPEYNEALRIAEENGGYSDQALELLKNSSGKDPFSAYALGSWYLHGMGTLKQDVKKAVTLFEFAGRYGNPDGLYELAVCYETGAGTEKSISRALLFYLLAAMRGDEQSFFEVGRVMHHFEVSLDEQANTLTEWILDISENIGIFEE